MMPFFLLFNRKGSSESDLKAERALESARSLKDERRKRQERLDDIKAERGRIVEERAEAEIRAKKRMLSARIAAVVQYLDPLYKEAQTLSKMGGPKKIPRSLYKANRELEMALKELDE